MMVNKLTPGHNLRWESSRFMLPQHVFAIQQQEHENKKMPKPAIDEQKLQEFNETILKAMEYAAPLRFTFWIDGFMEVLEGRITKLDEFNKLVWIQDINEEIHKMSYTNIVDIGFIDY